MAFPGLPIISAIGSSLAAGASAADSLFDISGNRAKSEQRYKDELKLAQQTAQRNIDLQREFAQNGIRWKIADAKAAGISPAAALGAGGASFSPVHVGSPEYRQDNSFQRGMASLSDMGQNIGRAIQAGSTHSQRLNSVLEALNVERAGLQNDLLRSQIAATNAQLGPPQPEEGVHIPDMTYSRTKGGGLAPVPSEGFADRAEDQWAPQIAWGLRNLLLPRDPDQAPPKGYYWSWNPGKFEFDPVPNSERWYTSPRGTWNQFRKWYNK